MHASVHKHIKTHIYSCSCVVCMFWCGLCCVLPFSCRQRGYEQRLRGEGWVPAMKAMVQRRYEVRPPTIAGILRGATKLQVFHKIYSVEAYNNWINNSNDVLEEEGKATIGMRDAYTYLACQLHMRVTPAPQLHQYWEAPRKPEAFPSRARFLLVHRHRYIGIEGLQGIINSNMRQLINPGSEVNLDELKAMFAGGGSTSSTFNSNKPHPWGHDFFLSTVKLPTINRSVVIAVKSRNPANLRFPTVDIVRQLDDCLPQGGPVIHYIADSFYNTATVRQLFTERGRVYTMAGKQQWMPHLWKVLGLRLEFEEWRDMYNAGTHQLASTFHSMKMCHTISTAFTPIFNPPINPQVSPVYQEYRDKFNWVDLFNRKYYEVFWPHRQMQWMDNFFDTLFIICVINAWVIYCENTADTRLTLKQFMVDLSNELFIAAQTV